MFRRGTKPTIFRFISTLARDALRAGPVNLLLSALDILYDDVSEPLASIIAPTLLVWGEKDVLVPPTLGEAAQQAIPDARLVMIGGAGHNVMWDQPRRFNQVVLDFLVTTPQPLKQRGFSGLATQAV
jgi:pimeloyl-ACP methyl ester carboxylesterase